ncbi:MAG: response regulator transcription factor [Alistipes sp.]
MKPKIAIIGSNSLMNIGLKTILERIIPMAEVCLFENADSLCANGNEAEFFHYFVSAQAYAERSRFFRGNRHKSIILSNSEQTMLPADMHILNISQSEDELVRAILRMHQGAHRGGYPAPNVVRPEHTTPLSERECEVLRLIVKGMLNKEIADALNISINTVITHRRNITSKLGMRSASALTIYAVTHGLAEI